MRTHSILLRVGSCLKPVPETDRGMLQVQSSIMERLAMHKGVKYLREIGGIQGTAAQTNELPVMVHLSGRKQNVQSFDQEIEAIIELLFVEQIQLHESAMR